LKAYIAVGGWVAGGASLSRMTANTTRRATEEELLEEHGLAENLDVIDQESELYEPSPEMDLSIETTTSSEPPSSFASTLMTKRAPFARQWSFATLIPATSIFT
jgi:hypothetical protein